VNGVLHINTASRRKARAGRLFSARFHKVGAPTEAVAMTVMTGGDERDPGFPSQEL